MSKNQSAKAASEAASIPMVLRAYSWLLRCIRPNIGLTKLSFNPVVERLLRGVHRTQEARYADGLTVDVDLDEYHGRILWLMGSNDWKVERTVAALLRRGDVMLDIGANYSSIGLAVRHVVGKEGHVHLFEPQSVLADRVQSAIDAGVVGNVTLHRVALFDSDGEMTLSGPSAHRGMATLVDESVDDRARERHETVQVCETGAYIAPLVSDRAFAVKIDIEGAEPQVLPGLLARPELRFIVFEGANNTRELWDLMTVAGFVIYGLARSPFRTLVEKLEAFEDWTKFHDFVAVRETEGLPSGRMTPARLASYLQ